MVEGRLGDPKQADNILDLHTGLDLLFKHVDDLLLGVLGPTHLSPQTRDDSRFKPSSFQGGSLPNRTKRHRRHGTVYGNGFVHKDWLPAESTARAQKIPLLPEVA
jgi:hypothetical protein